MLENNPHTFVIADGKLTLVLTKSRLPPYARKLMYLSFVLSRRSSSASPPAEVPCTFKK